MTATTTKPKAPRRLWSLSTPKVISRPVRVGKYIAVYRLVHKLYQIAVLDPANGHVLWAHVASPGLRNTASVVSPTVLDRHRLVYLTPVTRHSENYDYGYITVVDARTGMPLFESSEAYAVSENPERCGKDICFYASAKVICTAGTCVDQWDDTGTRWVRMKMDSGSERDEDTGLPALYLPLVGDLVLFSTGDQEHIARTAEHHVVWDRSVSSVFGPGYSFSTRWGWVHRGAAHLDVGSVAKWDHKGHIWRIGSTGTLLALDDATGKTRWTRTGDDMWCSPRHATDSVACHFSSATTLHLRRGEWVFDKGAKVSLVGYSTKTGATTWTVPLASPAGTSFDEFVATLVPIGGHGQSVLTPSGRIDIDLRTGKPLRSKTGDVSEAGGASETTTAPICTASAFVTLAQTHLYVDDKPYFRHSTADTHTPCTPAGKAAPPSAPLPPWAGAHVGPYRVLLTDHGLVGYRQRRH